MSFWIGLHILAAVVWVGGMFFAHMALRPAVAGLDPVVRVMVVRGTLKRFFVWVWISIIALLLSGYAILFLYLGGFAEAGIHVHLMQATGIIMMLLFAHLWSAPFQRLQRAVDAREIPAAAKAMGQIRTIITINLILGFITILLGATGRYWA